MRRLEREVLDVSGSERGRLGSEIHEDLGQDLAGVALMLRSLRVPAGPDGESLKFIIRQVNATIEKARVVARGLSPVQVSGGSLEHALPKLLGEISATWPVEVTCEVMLAGATLPAAYAEHLYRATAEAVTALAKRGTVRRIDVSPYVQKQLLILLRHRRDFKRATM